MLKMLGIGLILFVGFAIFITLHDDKQAAENAAQKAAQSHDYGTTGIGGEKQSDGNVNDPERHPPSWHSIFAWPNGVAAWGLFLTLWFIAVQADETRKSAVATERSVTITVNRARPRLLLKPEEFPRSINGIPKVTLEVSNIGGSKAICGICLGGMRATNLGEMPNSINEGLWPLEFTNSILDASHFAYSQIKNHPEAVIFPASVDISQPYMIHIYGTIVFRDMLFEDLWFRKFHYSWPVLPHDSYVRLREYSMPIWQPHLEEIDRRHEPPTRWERLSRAWRIYMVWLEKQSGYPDHSTWA